MNQLFGTFLTAAAVVGATLCAHAGQDLPINGDFYGAPTSDHIVPGWNSTPGGVRFFQGDKPGRKILELTSLPGGAKTAVSDMHQVGIGVLELKADVSGVGAASLGFEAYDASRRRLLQSDKQSWQLTHIPGRIKFNFPMRSPDTAFIRIKLAAEPGSVARFSGVEAEMKYAPPPPPPAPPAPRAPMLMDKAFYHLHSLPPVSVFQASVPAGRDISFKLGEEISRRHFWQLVGSYDPRICRVEMEHKHKHYSYARIELNALYRGTTRLEFVNPAGKRVIIHFTSL